MIYTLYRRGHEALAPTGREALVAMNNVYDEEEITEAESHQPFVVAVYLVDRAYGGPEEGGWWYDCGERVRIMGVFKNEARARDKCRRINRLLHATLNDGRRDINSVLSEGMYSAKIHRGDSPKYWPAQRPHYE